MKRTFYRHLPVTPILYIILLSVVTCLFLSNDGILYGPSHHYDSTWFWCCGKWTMQGLTPYVDFTDSKGLLLWIIYGLGYLITPHSYFGVCIISMFAFIFAYAFSYKTIRLFYERQVAMGGTALMVFAYWNGWIVTETHAETYIFPVVACFLYILLKTIKEKEGQHDYVRYGFVVGIGMMVALMIKWSIVIMLLGFPCSLTFLALRHRQLKKFTIGLFSGILLVAVPFLCWFVIDGNFYDFIHEYFVNTIDTVSVPLSDTIRVYYGEIKASLLSAKIVFAIMPIFSIRFLRQHGWPERILPCLSLLFAYAFAIHHDYFNYYLLPLLPEAVFIVLIVLRFMTKYSLLITSILSMLCTFGLRYYTWHDNFILLNHKSSTSASFEKCSKLFLRYEKPKQLNFGNEQGIGIYTDIQPACKYWSTQQNSTAEMNDLRLKTLRDHVADIVTHQPFVKIVTRKDIEAAGYKYEMNYGETEIYTKIINN